jgi:hypothetical protein
MSSKPIVYANQMQGGLAGQINYILQSSPHRTTVGWATYANTVAAATPETGTGGSPTIAFSRNNSLPLRGDASFALSTTASNFQGQGVSFNFTIDDADKAKVMSISFDYRVSATMATGDYAVYIYDVTNALLIQPAGYQIQGGVVGTNYKQIATFQTSSNSTSYRFIIHRAVTTASNLQFDFDNVIVGPQVVQYGAPITDPVAYTPSNTQGFGTISASNIKWNRNGAFLELTGGFTAGTTTGSTAQLALPTGMTIGGTTSARMYVGELIRAGGTRVTVIAVEGRNYLTFGSGASSQGDVVGSSLVSSSEVLLFNAVSIPITGWSSTVQMSNDTDTRVVAAQASLASATHTSTGNWQNLPSTTWTISNDSHSAMSSAGLYTVPVPGYYVVTGTVAFVANATGIRAVRIVAGGTTSAAVVIPASISDDNHVPINYQIYLTAGQTIQVQANQNSGGNLAYANNSSRINIFRLSGPSAIAASETVAARATNTAGTSLPDSTVIPWGTITFDTHGGMNVNGTYTIQTSGKYQVSATANFSSYNLSTSQVAFLSIKKNGSEVSRGKNQYGNGVSVNWGVDVTDTISCVAGDTITIVHNTNLTGTLLTSANVNHVSITRVGN